MINAYVQVITPEMAYNYLTNNTKNYRKIDPFTVKYYAQEMKAGRWQLNGEAIQFAKNGTLLNGQHRLNAIVESGVSVPMLVVTDVPDDVITYDEGKLRSAVDVARNMGADVTARDISLANLIVANNDFSYKSSRDALAPKIESAKYAAAHLKTIRQAWACARAGSDDSTGNLLNRAWAATAIYLLLRSGESAQSLRNFCVITNTGLPINGIECSPALVIRNMLFGQTTLIRHSDRYANMHYLALAYSDFKHGVSRRRTYALQGAANNALESLWHRVRKEDGLE